MKFFFICRKILQILLIIVLIIISAAPLGLHANLVIYGDSSSRQFIATNQITADIWLTTDKDAPLQFSQKNFLAEASTNSLKIQVNETNKYQQIEGFGAALTDSSAWLIKSDPHYEEIMNNLFSAKGLGINYLRLPIGASDFTHDGSDYNYDDSNGDSTLEKFSIKHDQAYIIPVLQKAKNINPRLKIIATPWSAPSWMTEMTKLVNGHKVKQVNPDYYEIYASYFAKFIQSYRANGLTIDAVTVQNEPQNFDPSYPTMWMEPGEQAKFVKILGRKFREQNIKTKIFIWDHNWTYKDYPTTVLNDTDARQYIAGVAWHCYDGGNSPQAQTFVHNLYSDKEVFFTECTAHRGVPRTAKDPINMDDMSWALSHVLIGATRNWAKTILYWNLALNKDLGPVHGGCIDKNGKPICNGLLSLDGIEFTPETEYYALAHLSKFIMPGAWRIDSDTYNNDKLIPFDSENIESNNNKAYPQSVAFQNTDNTIVLVVHNPSRTEKEFDIQWHDQHIRYKLSSLSTATFRWKTTSFPPVIPINPVSQPVQAACDRTPLGVILYVVPYYQGRCIRLLSDEPSLAKFNLDNSVSSIWINGDYTVKLYEDNNYGGRSDEFNKSDDNIDDRSLGKQWSSIRIEAKQKEGSCPNDNRSGVYFYKDKDFKGACFYTTSDVKDFGKTNVGNNNISSVRIRGDWRVNVYTSQNFAGTKYSFGDNQANLDNRSDVHNNISSARVKQSTPPAEQPVPACPAPALLQPVNGNTSGSRTVTFAWSGIVCERTDSNDLYRLRIKTVPNMDSGGETVIDQLVTGTSQALTLDAKWERRPLYWAVQVGNPKNGAQWSTPALLTVDTNLPPTIAIQQANEQTITTNEQFVWGNVPNWTFNGSASDADGTVAQVQAVCTGQSCNEQNQATLNNNGWSYQRNNLEGRNHLHVQAMDNLGAVSNGDNIVNLTVWVDRAAPQTGIVLNGNANAANWPQWFTDPVVVQLAASDAGSGSGANLARAGVKELRYRLDNGAWQTQSGDQLYLEINISGVHKLEYAAVDNVGNSEATHTQSIALDLTPPTPPGTTSEVNGVINDQWQKTSYIPSFTWNPATDEHSGVWGYQLYFGDDPNGEGYYTVRAGEPLRWLPQTNGVTTGSWYLRGRTRDLAGNWSDWTTLFTFRYDDTPPPNPVTVIHTGGVQSNVWQRLTNTAAFTWTTPVDIGASVQGYRVYWGTDPNGESSEFITTNHYQTATPLCGVSETCAGYLRLRTRDLVGNEAPNWSTAFVLRYDNTPPVLDFNINGGAVEANSTQVTLFISASDAGSGPAQMRFTPDGQAWTNWITYTTTYPWTIIGISGQTSTVYMQVRDGVGLASAVVNRSIRFNANIPQPASQNFIIFNSTFAAGGGEQTSGSFALHSTVAEPPDSAPMVSERYLVIEGYEAGGVAPPAAVEPPTTPLPTPCNTPPITINHGALFTAAHQVMLQFCTTKAATMQVSDNAGFNGAVWESYAITKTSTLAQPATSVAPLYAYVRFRGADGADQGVFADFIYYDAAAPLQPQIRIGDPVAGLTSVRISSASAADSAVPLLIGPYGLVQQPGYYSDLRLRTETRRANNANNNPAIDIYINGQDDLAGVSSIQLSDRADFAGATWQPLPNTNTVAWPLGNEDGVKTLYARVQDKAGNTSIPTSAAYTLDLTPPTGSLSLNPYVVGPNTDHVNIYLAAQDNLSGVTNMRISTDPLLLLGDVWRPYTTSLTIPAYLPLAGELPLYVQFRDAAGNVSDVYSDTYQVDVEAPSVTAEVDSGNTLARTLHIYGFDGHSAITKLRLSNDIGQLNQVAAIPYMSDVNWVFDERKVVWVEAEDSLGNITEPIPVSAGVDIAAGNSIYLPLIQR